MSYDFDHQQPQGLSGGAKVAIGCGAVAFLFMVVICGGIVWMWAIVLDRAPAVIQQAEEAALRVMKEAEKLAMQSEAFAERFEAEGYVRVTGQVLAVTQDIEQPTVYTVQVFQLNADSAADLAVAAQVAEIHGRIDGDLHFLGQSLIIHPDAVITGNLHVQTAEVVDNRGTVEGEVIEDEELDFEMPVPATPPERKPAPGDVIDRPEEPAAEPETLEPDTPEPAAPADDAAPAGEAPADDAAPAGEDAADVDAVPAPID
jgi:hypothetical protein